VRSFCVYQFPLGGKLFSELGGTISYLSLSLSLSVSFAHSFKNLRRAFYVTRFAETFVQQKNRHRPMPKRPLFVHQPNNSVCSSRRRDEATDSRARDSRATQIRFYLRAVTRRASVPLRITREKQRVAVVVHRS